jgi:hypothetical protein
MNNRVDDLLEIVIGAITGAMVVGLCLFVLYSVYVLSYMRLV